MRFWLAFGLLAVTVALCLPLVARCGVAGLIIVWLSWTLLFECCSACLLMLVGLRITVLGAVTTCWLAVCLLWVANLVVGVVSSSVLLFDCAGILSCSLLSMVLLVLLVWCLIVLF